MTAICPSSGTSSPNTGAVAVVRYSAGLIADLLVLIESPWLIPVIPLLGLGDLTLASFCATDPPTIPTFTSAETNAILNVQLGADFDSGIGKAKDVVLNAIWQNSCHCDVGTATPSSPPTIPSGTPIFQTPSAPASQPCETDPFDPFDGTLSTHNSAGPSRSYGNGSGQIAGQTVTALRLTITPKTSSGGGCVKHLVVLWEGPYPSSTVIRTDTINVNANSGNVVTLIPPANAWAMVSTMTYVSGAGTDAVTYLSEWYCNGTPVGGTQNPCCPPDASTQAYLDLILKQVTLIQRQQVPFAYVTGTAHAALSGNGSFAVQAILGLKIDITTAPARLGQELGEPIALWDAGWVNVGTADGYGPRIFITSDPMLVQPIMGDVTIVGYSIPADVVVTITELVREP